MDVGPNIFSQTLSLVFVLAYCREHCAPHANFIRPRDSFAAMQAPNAAKFKDVCSYVNGKLDRYEMVDNKEKIMLRAVISEIIDRLMVDGFVYMQRWLPQMCGVDQSVW